MTNIFSNEEVGTIVLLGKTLIVKSGERHKEVPLAKNSYEVSIVQTKVFSDGNAEIFVTNYTVFACNGTLYYLGEPEPILPETEV